MIIYSTLKFVASVVEWGPLHLSTTFLWRTFPLGKSPLVPFWAMHFGWEWSHSQLQMLIHTDSEKNPEAENLFLHMEGRERPKKEAGHSSWQVRFIREALIRGMSEVAARQNGFPCCLAGPKNYIGCGGGAAIAKDTSTWMLPGTEICIFDQVRPTLFHTAGGRRGVLIYVKMNVSYDQRVSEGHLQKAPSVLAWVLLLLLGQMVVMSQNSLSSSRQRGSVSMDPENYQPVYIHL